MKLSMILRRVGLAGLASVAAFASGAAVEPAPAGAHCGEHAESCGVTGFLQYYWCSSPVRYAHIAYYYKDCSGTCYSGGTQGCCESPEACANAPCKPGGCGSACEYAYSSDVPAGSC